MNRNMMLFGIVLLAGASFAQIWPTSGSEWEVYAQTCCQAFMLAGNPEFPSFDWANNVSDEYAVWDGSGCASPQMLYHDWEIWNMMWLLRGSVADYYDQMAMACRIEPSSSECQSAKAAFYSSARSARSAFTATRANYLLAARQNIFAYNRGYCPYFPPASVAENIQNAMANYRECMQDPVTYCIPALG